MFLDKCLNVGVCANMFSSEANEKAQITNREFGAF